MAVATGGASGAGGGGGGGGAVTTSAPVSGDGSGGSPITIAAGAIGLDRLANIASSRIMGRITAGAGAPEALTAAQAQTVMFGALAATGMMSVTTATGAVASTAMGTGAVPWGAASILTSDPTKLFFDGTSFIGIATSTTNITGLGAGTAGITMLGVGSTGGLIEAKMPTTTSSSKEMLRITAYNGIVATATILFDNNSSTTDGRIRMFVGSGGTQVASIISSGITFSVGVTLTATTVQQSGGISLTQAAGQSISKSGGALTVTTSDANSLILGTNATTRITIASDGKTGFFGVAAVAQPTIGANVNNVAASGTSGQFDDFTNGVTYATDYAALHATVYQLTRSVAQITVGLRTLGLGA